MGIYEGLRSKKMSFMIKLTEKIEESKNQD